MIYVRDDDVLVPSSSWADPLGRIQQVHSWLIEAPDKLMHIPTILVTEIQEFPECIEFVREETAEGRMQPQIHGLEHIDYAKLTPQQIKAHLMECQDWFHRQLNFTPTRWYTPWGAGFDENGAHLKDVAERLGLVMVGVKDTKRVGGKEGILADFKRGRPFEELDERELFIHWWEGGARLKRVAQVLKHGSWDAAVQANKKLFGE